MGRPTVAWRQFATRELRRELGLTPHRVVRLRGCPQPRVWSTIAGMCQIARVTAELLRDLPPRRQPPKTVPPLRRRQVRARELERTRSRAGEPV
jgi:hypothetical protein